MTSEDAERLRDRLRLSNDEHDRLVAIARIIASLKSVSGALDGVAVRRLVAEHGAVCLGDALDIVLGEPRPVLGDGAMQAFRRFASGEEPMPVFPLRGADLLARGVPAGPRVGDLLDKARAAWLAAGCPPQASLDELLPESLNPT
jgi:poly(A) polymerase